MKVEAGSTGNPEGGCFNELFHQRRRVLLPVIHVENGDQAMRNAMLAREHGCPGVFLINHGISSTELLEVHEVVRRTFPGWFVGLNLLDLSPSDAIARVSLDTAGLWVDNAMIDEREAQQPRAEGVLEARRRSGWGGLYFGGVAFKYQRPVTALEEAAKLATRFMDVVTTSGEGTGIAASVEKIRRMKAALGTFPLAIASGVTPENVHDYLPWADCFLVATGISAGWSELDKDKLMQLVDAVDDGLRGDFPELSSVCFICEWNEGRSAHLELSVRRKLRLRGKRVRVASAGLRQGGRINHQRRKFLRQIGVPESEIDTHVSTVINEGHLRADLILVSELWMKEQILAEHPASAGKVMTVRGFLKGFTPASERVNPLEAHIEDAGGHSEREKQRLYEELESLATQTAVRLAKCGA